MVSTCTASASDSSRRLRSSSLVSCSAAAMRRRSHDVSAVVPICSVVAAACRSWPTWRRSVSRRSPSTGSQRAAGHALDERDRLRQRRDARAAQHRGPVGAGGGGRPPRRRRPRRRRARRTSRGTRSSPPRAPAWRRCGRSIASRRRSHSRAGAVPNTLPGAVDHRGDADRVERVADEGGVAVAAHEHGDVARTHRRRARAEPSSWRSSISAPESSSPARSAARSRGDVLARRRRRRVALRASSRRRVGALGEPDPQRRGHRRAGQARRAVGRRRAHRAMDDALVAEPGAAEERVVGVEQPLVAAPVDGERGALRRRRGRLEIGVDVRAAEGVDRLLRVADQDQRRAARRRTRAGGCPTAPDPCPGTRRRAPRRSVAAAARPRPRRSRRRARRRAG